ncbi:outer membrane protein transport protein [candidate division KSB1 bacterium]|nr:outer membrane protein transport protein [candidate division KSB1 bacterium]
MKRKLTAVGIFICLFGWLNLARAQEEVFQRGFELGIGTRALGMGGAYLGVADDYSASFWNPAGLAQIRRLEGFGTLSYLQRKNDISAVEVNANAKDDLTSTQLNSIGLAYPVPTYQGSLVFGIGYHRVHPYDASLKFRLVNATANDANQSWSILEEGGLNNWVFAGAVEVAPNISLGAALNIFTGNNDYTSRFTEIDDVGDRVFDFSEARFEDVVNSKYSGYNLRLGALYRPMSFVRLGLTLTTPTFITGTDNWKYNDTTIDDQDSVFTDSDAGEIKYKIRSPFSLAAGAAVNLPALMVSGSVEWTDWSQTRYLTEPPFEVTSFQFDDERSLANDSLRTNYRNTLRLRAGAEFTLPILNLQFRAGGIYDPQIRKGLPSDSDRKFLTAGLGIFLDKQTRFDVALMHGEWTEYSTLDDFSDDVYSTSEKINYNKILASLAVRF